MDSLIERLAALTARLVAFATIDKKPDVLVDCLNWVSAHIAERAPQLHTLHFESAGIPSRLFWAGDGLPRVLYCGHLDVVAAGAFRAVRQPGARLEGRGTADMKGPVAALVDLLVTEQLPGIGLLLTTDEESGGMHGTKHVLEALKARDHWKPDVVILPDGGANMRLVVEQKGLMRLHVVATGKAGHAARPWKGRSALDQLFRGYRALRRAYPLPSKEEDWRISITLTQLHTRKPADGGNTASGDDNAPNSVPGCAEGMFDIRFPGSGPDATTQLYPALCQQLARFDIHADLALLVDPFVLDLHSPWVDRLQTAALNLQGRRLAEMREAGGSDARFFAAEGVPVLIFQPRCGGAHGDREWISLPSLKTFHALCGAFAREAVHGSAVDGSAVAQVAQRAQNA